MLRPLLFSLLLATGCGSPYADAQKADTIEAYEAFLEAEPNSRFQIQAESRLAELYLDKAREEKTLEAYDSFLARFGEGPLAAKATEERREVMWDWAEQQATAEAWQKFIDEYPSGDRKLKAKARRRLKMAENKDSIELGPVEMAQINLAEDPEGPLDGWGFYADVENVGTREIAKLVLRIDYLDADGKVVDSREWPAVAPHLPGYMPVEEEFKVPMKPGETRTWEWTTGDMPAGWAKQSRIAPVDITYVGEDDAE